MSDYERLSRGNYQADGKHRSAQQEASELSRANYRPDAVAKASEQEEAERQAEERARARAHTRAKKAQRERTPHARTSKKQQSRTGDTVMRRTTDESEQKASGGAVVSKRSRLGSNLRRRLREVAAAESVPSEMAARDASRASRRPKAHTSGPLKTLALVILVVVGLYVVFCSPIDRAISLSADERQGLSKELSWHVPGMPYYVLALGSDAREGETVSRSDTMILVRVDTLGGKITMLSIPRDTKVEIEGYGTQKINAAYAFGGTAGAVRAVSKLCGVPISHVATVHFDGIESLVDYLGGVTVDVPVDVYDPEYTGLVLPAGKQEMDGETALLFSRVRHGFDLGDYQRQKDQRILIQAIMDKALSLPPWKVPGLLRNMSGLLGTTMRMYNILPLMARLKLGGATIYQATVPSDAAMIDGVSYVIADEQALAQMMDVIKAGGDPAADDIWQAG